MSQEPALTIEQLAEALKIPESLLLSYRDKGMLPPAVEGDGSSLSDFRYLRSEIVRKLRENPDAMDAIRRAIQR